MVFGVKGKVVTLLWLQRLVSEDDLWFAAIDRVIVVVELIQSWCTESRRVGGAEVECTG